jgi:hypothetical protein
VVVRSKIIPTVEYRQSVYGLSSVQYGLLSVWIEGGNGTADYAEVGGLYPVVIDLYDDRSPKALEVWFKVGSWQVRPDLQPPKELINGKVLLVEDEPIDVLPALWTNRRRTTLYVSIPGEEVTESLLLHIRIASDIVIDATDHGIIAGLWFLNLPDEVAKHANFA